ncbi:transposase [Candidatus Kuenenbacteria bacterium]|nr:transposase [Candidatus Kuenenbacteria bacterium]
MLKPPFVEDEIYHIYNRGVEKRNIFLDDKDYLRFIHDLFEFNDEEPALNIYYRLPQIKSYEVEPRKIEKTRIRKLLVEILVFTLMPNHFHLILKQKKEGGIVRFMQKLGTGYTMYFNQKYERVGSLFQGKFKAVHIEKESHFTHLPFYIHTNPLKNLGNSISKLEEYRWSSFPDYIGKKNFPSVTSRELFLDFFGGEEKYLEQTKQWIKERKNNFEKIKEITLE